MNLLMYGPPGTGKTEFVKYLGKELDRKVIVMKGSDILGMYRIFCRWGRKIVFMSVLAHPLWNDNLLLNGVLTCF